MKRLQLSRRMTVLTVVVLGVFGGGAARAYFTAAGTGTASARVGTFGSPSNVTATATSGSAAVPVTWDAPSPTVSPEGYYVVRNTSGAPVPAPACGTSATALSTSTSCDDLNLPDGTYTYTVVARYHSFSADATSDPVTVVSDNKAPGVTLTSPAEDSATTATATAAIGGAAGNATGDSSKAPVKVHDGTTATNTLVLDTSAPTLSGLQMVDGDANGKVDEVRATFSEPLVTSTATAPWTLTNVPSGGTLRAVSTSGTVATLTIDEGSDAADTSVGSFRIALAASANAIRDAAGNQASFAATAPSDLAAPTLSGLQMVDGDANGKVDEVRATFSEPLVTSTATAPWTLTNVPSGGTLRAVSTSGTVATLTIDEGSDAADTSVGSFKVALATGPSAIRDTAGNQASFAATAPRDLAGPVLMTAASDSGTAPNLMQPGDTLALTFSEALAPNSVPVGPDVTESRSSSTATLAITGLITPTTIDAEYLDESGDSATFSTASALTNRTVTVTLDTGTANGSVSADAGGASILPSATLKDPAGNAAASAAPAAARRVSRLF